MEEEKNVQENEVVQIEEGIVNNSPVNVVNEEVTNVVSNENKPPKKNNGLVCVLVFIILLLVGGLVYVLFFMGDDKDKGKGNGEPTPTPSVTPTPTPEPTNEPEGEHELTVYKREDDGILMIQKEKTDSVIPAFVIKTNSNNSKILATYGESFVLYRDVEIYLYDAKTKRTEKINIDNNYKAYAILSNKEEDKIIGIAYINNNDTVGYYNVPLNKKLYDGKYKFNNMSQGTDYDELYDNLNYMFRQINDNKIVVIDSKRSVLLDCTKEKEEISYKHDGESVSSPYYAYYENGNSGIYTLNFCVTDYCGITNIYNDQFKEIYSGEVSTILYSFYNENIYLGEMKDNNKYTIKRIDLNGKTISSIELDVELYMIDNNYAIYNKNNKLIVENIDNNDIKEIATIGEKGHFDEYESGYYTRIILDELGETDKKEGLYIVIDYENVDSNGNSGMEYCLTPDKQIIEYPIKQTGENN